jgi:lauroyl/myristoyl acyltransferase
MKFGRDLRGWMMIRCPVLLLPVLAQLINLFFISRPTWYSRKQKRNLRYFKLLAREIRYPGGGRAILKKRNSLRAMQGCSPAMIAFRPDKDIKRLVEVRGYEHVEAAMQGGRGVVIASTHLGCPGSLSAYAARKGIDIYSIRRKEVGHHQSTFRGRLLFASTKPLFIEWDEAPVGILKKALGILRNNGAMIYLPDGPFGGREIDVQILGREVTIRTGLAEVARIAGAPIIPAFAVASRSRVLLTYGEPIKIGSAEDIEHFANCYAKLYESVMREYPQAVRWLEFDRQIFQRPRRPKASAKTVQNC